MRVGGYELHQRGGGVQQGKNRGLLDTGINTYTGKLIFQSIVPGTAIASTAALTAFDQQPTIAKGLLNVVGARVTFQMWGVFGSTGTPALQVFVKLDDITTGDLISANAVAAVGNNATAWSWRCNAAFVVAAIGGSGTLRPASTLLTLANNTTGVALVNQVIGSPVSPTNTNTTRIIVPGVQWGASSASNTIQVTGMSVEIDYPYATA